MAVAGAFLSAFSSAPAQQPAPIEPLAAPPLVNQVLATDDAAATGSDQQNSETAQTDGDLSVGAEIAGTAEVSEAGVSEIVESSLDSNTLEPGGLHFQGAFGTIFDDNIFLDEENKTSDVILLARLGASYAPVESGNGTFRLTYTATGYSYLDHSDLDAVNQAIRLTSSLKFNKTDLGLNARYQHSAGGADSLFDQFSSNGQVRPYSVERQGQQFAERDSVEVTAKATHELASKTILDSLVGYRGDFYKTGYSDEQLIQGRLGLGYKITEKTILGGATAYRHIDMGDGSTEQNIDLLLAAKYNASDRIKIAADVGIKFRQLENDSAKEESNTPAFRVQADYQMRPRTALFLNAARTTDGSASLSGTFLTRSFVLLGLNQNLGSKVKFSISGGIERAEYDSLFNATSQLDDGQYWFTRLGLVYAPNQRFSAGAFYGHMSNDGGDTGLNYETNQFGIQIALAF